ncbi:isochorismatase family protein [Variovorax paradoxus]|uniref:Isochorismatase family protein n=1 Tax=Variovorax paradoxus TaxID=34073 RepID=A0A5Q0M7A8_VARPD|nr:cysteine hydrolase family protein [Variovorax paradoxus]QFZ84444.1 isochorismatase family protein [Variovorax paradoxus]
MKHPSIRSLTGAVPTSRLDPASTALIAIDFQNEYFDGRMPIPDGGAALRQARRLIDAADRHAMSVFHVQHVAPADSPIFADGSHAFGIHDALHPAPQHTVLRKATPSAFAGTALEAELQARGITTLILTGLMTHMCVSATAFDAAPRGYQSLIVGDACATRDLDLEEGGVLSHRELHRAALRGVSDVVAEVRSTDEVLRLLEAGA